MSEKVVPPPGSDEAIARTNAKEYIMRYRKKPIVIDAMQFTDESKDRVYNWIVGTNRCADFDKFGQPILKIETLEGIMIVNFGDWVIKGVEGEFYPCKPKIFEQTYEKV